jgi:hypothetical protein
MLRSATATRWSPLVLVILPLAACGGTTGQVSAGAGPSQNETADAAPEASAAGTLAIHIHANTAAFQHTDGASGQTASSTRAGVRSLRLLRSPSDPEPLQLFDLGATPVEAGFDDGNDTVVAQVAPGALVAGAYMLARLVITHSRFTIDGTMHVGAAATPGTFDDVLVMSNGTLLDGTLRDAGFYDYVFDAGGQKTAFTGANAAIAGYSTTAGARGVVESGEWAVYFPVALMLPANVAPGSTLTIDVNMYESFRWTDLALAGFTAGVFDTTTTSYEPVVRFGGNSFVATLR